jgi:steroid delta-isomerase-like uncharacterized protein
MAKPDENKALIQRIVDAANARDMQAARALLDDNIVDHEAPPDAPQGIDGVRQRQTMLLEAFPDLRITTEELIADGDMVVGRFTFSGTHSGAFVGMPPTGRRIHFEGIDINRIAGGKIVERWGQTDMFGLLQQLGAAPAQA